MAGGKKTTERYLKIPYHILNIAELGLSEKVLLAHIYSFGDKGCWQSNATLADIFSRKSLQFSLRPVNVSLFVPHLSPDSPCKPE